MSSGVGAIPTDKERGAIPFLYLILKKGYKIMKHGKLTKKQRAMLYTYIHADNVTLESLYKTEPSQAKKSASLACVADYGTHNGYRMRFMRGGCFFFQFGFLYSHNEDYTVHLRYHTAYNVYDFAVADIDNETGKVTFYE